MEDKYIYVLNNFISKQVERGKEEIMILFVDLKAAFDSVDREKLVKAIRERGVKEGLVKRCEVVLREMKDKTGEEKEGEEFWTVRGVRQRYALSPCLFSLIIADVEKEIRKGSWGRELNWGKCIYWRSPMIWRY